MSLPDPVLALGGKRLPGSEEVHNIVFHKQNFSYFLFRNHFYTYIPKHYSSCLPVWTLRKWNHTVASCLATLLRVVVSCSFSLLNSIHTPQCWYPFHCLLFPVWGRYSNVASGISAHVSGYPFALTSRICPPAHGVCLPSILLSTVSQREALKTCFGLLVTTAAWADTAPLPAQSHQNYN